MTNYLDASEMITLWRPMTPEELDKAEALIPVVCSSLRLEAKKVDMNLDELVASDEDLQMVAKSVVCDVVARMLVQSTNQEAVTQFSQTAGSYTVSGSYLTPGGGLFIKKQELARLGIKRQRFGGLNVYSGD